MLHWPKKSLVMPFYYINFDQNRPPYKPPIFVLCAQWRLDLHPHSFVVNIFEDCISKISKFFHSLSSTHYDNIHPKIGEVGQRQQKSFFKAQKQKKMNKDTREKILF